MNIKVNVLYKIMKSAFGKYVYFCPSTADIQ